MWADYPAPVTLHKNFALLFIQSMSAKHTSIKTRTKNQQPESAHDVQDEQVSEVETPARKASLSAADAAYKKAAKSTARTPEKVAGSKNKEIPSPAPDKPEEPADLLKKLDETQAQSKNNHELYLRAASDLDNYRRPSDNDDNRGAGSIVQVQRRKECILDHRTVDADRLGRYSVSDALDGRYLQ